MRVLSASLLLFALAIPAAAQEPDAGVVCEDPTAREPLTVMPAVGAREVSLDAPLRVRYTPGYFESGTGGDPTTLIFVQRCPVAACDLFSCMDPGEFVPGRVQVLGDELVFLPDEPWAAGQAYSGVARGLDDNLPFQFCTGSAPDTSAPTFGRLTNVTSTPVSVRCDSPEGGYRVAVTFPPASDPGGPPASIEYLLFQTRGAEIEEPVLRDRVPNFAGTDTITSAFVLAPSLATAPICVRVAAVDGVGNFTWSEPRAEDCVNPVQGNYFYGLCSASAPGASAGFGVVLFAALGVLVLRRRRR